MKNKFLIYMSIFLSLSLVGLSSVRSEAKEEVSRTTTKVQAIGPNLSIAAIDAQDMYITDVQSVAAYIVAHPPPAPKPYKPKSHPSSNNTYTPGMGNCGGNLPPCSVLKRESGGNLSAYNPSGCNGRGCYGKWQCDPRTCSGQGTEAEQDAEAAALWDNGNGCSHWNACG